MKIFVDCLLFILLIDWFNFCFFFVIFTLCLEKNILTKGRLSTTPFAEVKPSETIIADLIVNRNFPTKKTHKELLSGKDFVVKRSKNGHAFSIIGRPRHFGMCVYCLQKPNANNLTLRKITTFCPQCPNGCWTCEPCFDERHPI